MKKHRIGILLGVVVALTGCVPSLHPLYTDEDLIFDPALVGTWGDEDSQDTWTFAKSGEKEYRLVYTDQEGKKGKFVAHLLKVDGRMYLDLFPDEPDLEANDFYKGHLLPVHSFMRIATIEPNLRCASVNPEWLDEFLKQNPDAIKHERLEDGVVLTAQPKELQAFLAKHDTTEGAFGDFSDMVRKEAASGE
jgi:hypothetical protein